MKKIKLRAIACLLSVIIAISSFSIVSVSATEGITNTSATIRGHETNFTDEDLYEFCDTFNLYYEALEHLKSLGVTNPDIIKRYNPFPNEYKITRTSDPTKPFTDSEIKLLVRQIEFMREAKKSILSAKTVTFFESYSTYESWVANEVVQFPDGVILEKLPDKEHPKGLKISRSGQSTYLYESLIAQAILLDYKKTGANSRTEAYNAINTYGHLYLHVVNTPCQDAYNYVQNQLKSYKDVFGSVLCWVNITSISHTPSSNDRNGNTRR